MSTDYTGEVLDKDGNAYLSVQPVPAGVSLDRTDYWTNIGNFSALWESVKEAITIPDEGHETTASAPRAVYDLVWVNGQLLEVTSPMIAGDTYVIGSNCRIYSMQIMLTELLQKIQEEATARESADNGLLQKIQEETTARESADNDILQKIQEEATARESADNDLLQKISNMEVVNVKDYGAVGDGTTDDTEAIQNAFNAAGVKVLPVYFPAGTYNVTSITNGNAVPIIGAGCRTSCIRSTLTTGPVITTSVDYSRIIVRDILISRVNMGTDFSAVGLELITSGEDFHIHNVRCEKQYVGMQLSNVAMGWISECYATNCEYGFLLNGYNGKIQNCLASYINANGYRFTKSNGVFISGCQAYRTKGAGFYFDPANGEINDIQISDCLTSTTVREGFFIDANATIQMTNCFVEYAGYNTETEISNIIADGIYLGPNTTQVEITNCIINVTSGRGIQALGSNFTISSCAITNVSMGQSNGYDCIYIPTASHDFIIANCNFYNNTLNPTNRFNILIENANANYFIVHDCIFNGTSGISNAASGKTFDIHNNIEHLAE